LEFRAIALKAPLPQWQELPAPTLQGEKLIAQISKIAALKQRAKEVPGAKDWAKRIIQRHQSGDQVRPVALRFAREALRLEAA
jgi:hypothetical protein